MLRPTYYERFKEAFVNEVNAFTEAVLDDKRESPILFGASDEQESPRAQEIMERCN
jgi:hypothetical protein